VAPDGAPAQLYSYVQQGGRALLLGARPPDFAAARVIRTVTDLKGYVRVRDHALYPSLRDTDLLMVNGPFTELEGDGSHTLSLVPPSMIGPPEKIHVDMRDTATPGVVTIRIGAGVLTWIPWDLGALYYRHSLPAHAGLFRDLVAALHAERQVKTNAHPLVQLTLMQQHGRTLVHLVNLSGHSHTGYFAPVPMRDIRIDLAGIYRNAYTLRSPGTLPMRTEGKRTRFAVPVLNDYELIVLQ
jgi:hypothetical protein